MAKNLILYIIIMSFPNGGSTGETKLYNARFRRAVCNTKRSCLNILDRSFQAITDVQEEDKCNNSSTNSNRATFRYHKPNNKQDNHHSEKAIPKKKMRMSLKTKFFGINKINAQRL